MKKPIIFTLVFLLTLTAAKILPSSDIAVQALSAEEIMNFRDDNEYIEAGYIESRMIIEDRRIMEKEMHSYIKGNKALVEFTNPRDRGTKYLLLDDELWMYFPSAEDMVRISGHMMNQSMMGSDFSYQDMMESDRLSDLYEFTLLGEEQLGDRSAYLLEGKLREGQEAAYFKRKTWADSERFIALREELYARNGQLLKIMSANKVEKQSDGRWYPREVIMEDQLRENSRTIFQVNELDFAVDFPADIFSLDNLQ